MSGQVAQPLTSIKLDEGGQHGGKYEERGL